jgi:peptide subunit release factor 1 (eRF1)
VLRHARRTVAALLDLWRRLPFDRLVLAGHEEAPAQRAVNGVAGTLDALGSGQVHLLVVADRLTASAAECPTCGRLVADGNGGADRCPACGERLRPADDLRDLAVRRAAAQGARIEVVSGEAAALLPERGGIGAWVRS